MSKFQQKRSVIILAISKDNPWNIYGYCPGYEKTKFPTSGWSRRRVYLFECDRAWKDQYLYHDDTGLYGMTGKERWDFYYKNKIESYNGWSARKQMHGKVTMLKKLLKAKSGTVCGRSPNEYNWKFAKQTAAMLQKELNKDGYKNFEVKCFRVGSKICPVEVDFTERQEMFYCSSKYNRDRWTNPCFELKPLESQAQETLTI